MTRWEQNKNGSPKDASSSEKTDSSSGESLPPAEAVNKAAAKTTQVASALGIGLMMERVAKLSESTQDSQLAEFVACWAKRDATVEHLNNYLMDNFRRHKDLEAYSLLYEVNYKAFLQLVLRKVRFYNKVLDPTDIVQDVFLSVYRYPDRFRVEKETSFRNWSYSIVRNTILKHLKQKEKVEASSDILSDIIEDKTQSGPLDTLDHRESIQRCHQLYLVYLLLYLKAFDMRLSEREKRALHLVEVEGLRYREASELLDIKLENLKMVICRARKKILRAINQMIGG